MPPCPPLSVHVSRSYRNRVDEWRRPRSEFGGSGGSGAEPALRPLGVRARRAQRVRTGHVASAIRGGDGPCQRAQSTPRPRDAAKSPSHCALKTETEPAFGRTVVRGRTASDSVGALSSRDPGGLASARQHRGACGLAVARIRATTQLGGVRRREARCRSSEEGRQGR